MGRLGGIRGKGYRPLGDLRHIQRVSCLGLVMMLRSDSGFEQIPRRRRGSVGIAVGKDSLGRQLLEGIVSVMHDPDKAGRRTFLKPADGRTGGPLMFRWPSAISISSSNSSLMRMRLLSLDW